MAGRGVDILLGGNPEFLARESMRKAGLDPLKATPDQREKALLEARRTTDDEHEKVVAMGGLHITGTERHEARRIDNQLRGRAGRQGDPGSSRFNLSLQDDLLRIFGGERIQNLMLRSDIVQAAAEGKFRIYPIHTIDEGIGLLTGVPAGERCDDGTFEVRTANFLVDNELTRLAHASKNFFEDKESKNE